LSTKKAALDRFMKAYRETVDLMYSDDKAVKVYADWLGISIEKAKRTRDEFFPKVSIDPDKVVGLETIIQDAVTMKYTAAPLSKEQLAELIQIPPR
jgi:NitT/TauT family transport system substrate-binding protein